MRKKETKPTTSTGSLAKQETTNLPIGRSGFLAPFFGPTPFNLMRQFTDDMERMFEDFGNFRLTPYFERDFAFPASSGFQMPAWSPQIEVAEANGELTVRADLPGLKKEDIHVEVMDDSLVISGERTEESKDEREGFYRTERSYGSFYRRVPLPEGANKDKATATFQDGVLQVTLSVPAREVKGRKLEIAEKGEKSHAKAA
jgi:HSP20 family protein